MSRMSVGKRIIMSVYPPASPFRTSASDMRDKDNKKILITLNVLKKGSFVYKSINVKDVSNRQKSKQEINICN